MKKLPYFLLALILICAMTGVTGCGPSEAEKARMDSIRMADSLRRIDSIQIADSLNAILEAEKAAKEMLEKMETEAGKIKAEKIIQAYKYNKIFYINDGGFLSKQTLHVLHVATGEKKSISLPESNMWGGVCDATLKGDDRTIVVSLYNSGNLPILYCYEIDAETEKIKRMYEDY